MNSYRIDTFQLSDGSWKAAAYRCGTYIGESTGRTEAWTIVKVAIVIAKRLDTIV